MPPVNFQLVLQVLTWGDQTQGFVKLINKQLRPESYNKIVMGAWDIAKKSCSVVCTEEVIDLMGDEPPDGFAMLINVPSDDDRLEDRRIPIIKNHHVEHKMGPNIISNTEQAANTGWDKSYGDWSGYGDMDNTGIFEDEDDGEELDYISN